MDILNFIYGWFYYGFLYMALSAFATLMLNRATKKLWLSPLIINAVSIIILLIMVYGSFISKEDTGFAMYFVYMPIVASSILVNLTIFLYQKIRDRNKR